MKNQDTNSWPLKVLLSLTDDKTIPKKLILMQPEAEKSSHMSLSFSLAMFCRTLDQEADTAKNKV